MNKLRFNIRPELTRIRLKYAIIFLILSILFTNVDGKNFPGSLRILKGDINGAVLQRNDHRLVIYGDPGMELPNADMVLFTHSRRDITWAGRQLIEDGAQAVAPFQESRLMADVDSFWNDFSQTRFHDYKQQGSKIMSTSVKIDRRVKGGDTINWQGSVIRVLDTPGYSRGAVSYVFDIEGRVIAFTGDLIFGDGQLFDLYSLQDEVEELNIMGYHGYASRTRLLIQSLEKIASFDPDFLIPVRGPPIEEPDQAIRKLIQRLQVIYENYLSINAFRWYTGNEKQVQLAQFVLPSALEVDWLPMADTMTGEYPGWYIHNVNSKLIRSNDGSAFLIDCGLRSVFNGLTNLKLNYGCSHIEGVFISHYHDDHTDYITHIQRTFGCPVYVTRELEDVLNNPEAYRLPAMSSTPIDSLVVVPEEHKMRWKEFTFTFYYFPGQTLYHDAVLVEKDDGEKLFFVGDSFSPTGVDDYCLQNRNFIRKGKGFLYCLDILKHMPEEVWLVNQHIRQPFRFSSEQLEYMEQHLMERKLLLDDLFPWEDPNYGIDERWARIYPYGQKAEPGLSHHMDVIILNHGSVSTEYTIRPHSAMPGIVVHPEMQVLKVPPGQEGKVRFRIDLSEDVDPGICIITADIEFNEWALHQWCETMIHVRDPEAPLSLRTQD